MSICFQIGRRFPGLMMKLLVKASSNPVVRFDPNKVTVQANGTVTAYAIQPNATLTPLFILNLVGDTAGITNQHSCGLWKTKMCSHLKFFAGDKRERPSVSQRDEVRRRANPEQVSHCSKKNFKKFTTCSQRG